MMEKEKLISLWIAHGFLLSKGKLEPEDIGNEVWKELYLRSFFQEVDEYKLSGDIHFKMHDLIHDLAISVFSANTPSNKIRQVKVAKENIMSIGFTKVLSHYSAISPLQMFASLRVLDLSRSNLKQLSSSIGDLTHLRYLNLFDTRIRSLPKRLCKLQNLQTLDLSNCTSLSSLPKQTSKLCSLRNLLLHHCLLDSIPPRIGLLTCLKTLGCFVVGRKKGYQLGELGNLNLHGSILITHLERVKNHTKAKKANLSAKANLHSLSMSWNESAHKYESEEVKVLEALEPHPNLKYLEITGFSGFSFPNWMNHSVLKKVVSIQIRHCINCSCLPPFGELPCLESLHLNQGSAEVKYVEEDDVHSSFPTRKRFPSLRKLHIWGFPNLKGLLEKEGEEQFPMLEMKILFCPMFVFPTLSSIKELLVLGDMEAIGLNSISNLRTLTFLHISTNHKVTSLSEEMFKSLTNLKYLSIYFYKNLKKLPTSLSSLNALKRLQIECCESLESLPEGLQNLTTLTSLEVTDCPILAKRCEKDIGQDWLKIAHIPELICYSY